MEISQKAEGLLSAFEESLAYDNREGYRNIFAGVDLGTANIVTAVVDDRGVPWPGWSPAAGPASGTAWFWIMWAPSGYCAVRWRS